MTTFAQHALPRGLPARKSHAGLINLAAVHASSGSRATKWAIHGARPDLIGRQSLPRGAEFICATTVNILAEQAKAGGSLPT